MAVPALQDYERTVAQESIETRTSWIVAGVVLFILTFSYGAPLLAVVALKPIAADLGNARSVPALANSLAWLGSGAGAIGFGWIAERFGIARTVLFGAVMVGVGLAFASIGSSWELLIGHGLLVGVLGGGAINVPLIVYISRWFDRRRGSAVALVSSGQYIAGALWPPCIALGIAHFGWRVTMFAFGIATTVAIGLAALMLFRPAPESISSASEQQRQVHEPDLRLSSRMTFALLCLAMPPTHLVALCSDLGIAPAQGALMLSVLLGSAFVSRQFWGWLTDRIGGLLTIVLASTCQAAAMLAFVFTQDEAGLFAVSAGFGLGFSGIIPAYVVVLRQLFPAGQATWRVPVWFFANICGMALGGWLAGILYDQLGSYGPAFLVGLAFNLANILLIGWMAARQHRLPRPHVRAALTEML